MTSTEIIEKIKQRGRKNCLLDGADDSREYVLHELELSLHHALFRLGQMATGPGIIGAEARITLDEIEKRVR